MSSLSSIEIDADIVAKITVAAKRLGVDSKSLVNSILSDWLKNNRKLVITTDEILYEYEKSLKGYSESTKKTKLKTIKSFLEWCETNGVEPDEEPLEKYLCTINSYYSKSYISHAKSALKDFVEWYRAELS
ncbi:MAG: phage integrase N-terminal SAM-like domain-containing protein [Ignisphaera sp.]|uniref:Core-binding (CB) domain-containing protein n=1 Tax=Ignisphaera aggregans TaxID=334771 RepID=A0A7J3MWU5_9CREN